ncbi:MarR family winged helix-turn-helix transcriptional regulator [Spirilliplanes yamanashiensis]|uniref:MarR family transcriptional regulator n=1 Tax=Spirilliplanes yamanashiensis TaxID=42233 RepID=A0A8J4DGX7_9ACTN|nr:MarR family transcriptional regulator [Spirilliplanes yamanashiensis]MDP9819486.1 DNA-binding MarR family transcriptional regulator [Spirilliplanes yamanashiensis]GIJ01692.1 MarR family transcriptional regulator [Spirilliplanes yamanashiensis]
MAGPTRWLTPEEQAAWRAYLGSTRLLVHALDRQLEADAGLSFTEYETLVRLSEAPGRRLRMRDLAGASAATRSGVTRTVTRLERAGLVRRVECEQDRRGMHAELTDAGAAALAAAAPGHVASVRAHLFDHLDPADVGRLRELFGRIRDGLDVTGEGAQAVPPAA